MAADWNKLGKKYADSDAVVIVDVDCTADDAQSLCQRFDVKGYPTLKYFMAGDKKGKPYEQGRDFAALDNFVKSKLGSPPCNVSTKKGCAANEVEFIDKHAGKTAEELGAELQAKKDELKQVKDEKKEAEKEFKEKSKEWAKKEKLITKASQLLSQLHKQAK